jgi:3-hydroxybutyryl-CoA dehydrogenase
MSLSGFQNVGVIGAGQMGAGIAQVVAGAGLKVVLLDQSETQLEVAKASIAKSASKLCEKSKITEQQRDHAMQNINYVSAVTELKDCDLVVEAIVENERIKVELFRQLDELLKPEAIIASNTSSIPITRLAAATKRPDRFIGMHFMNPVPIMKLVEVISGLATSDETRDRIQGLAEGLNKEISSSQDFPGFVVNRILMPMINEAFFTLMEGVATAEDIDKGMTLGCNLPMGPLVLADFIGLDTCLAIMKVIFEGTGDSKHRPCPLLQKYVEAGYYGRKAGRGVYDYSK